MYSVVLATALLSAPMEPAGVIFHRQAGAGCSGAQAGAGCQGQQAQQYAVVPVQQYAVVRAAGCNGSVAGTGCNGSYEGRGNYGPHVEHHDAGLAAGHRARVEARQERRAARRGNGNGCGGGDAGVAVANAGSWYSAIPMQSFIQQTQGCPQGPQATPPIVNPGPGPGFSAPPQPTQLPAKQVQAPTQNVQTVMYVPAPRATYHTRIAVPCPTCPGGVRWISG